MTTAFGRCFKCAFIVIANCLLFVMVFSGLSPAAQLTLAWNVNSDPSVAGYKLYYGKASEPMTSSVDVGKVTRYTLAGIEEGKPSYFAVTAYDTNRNESAYSTELECFSLVPSAGVNGSISPVSAVVVSRGMSQIFRVFPAAQYTVSDVLVDAASVGPVEAYTFSNVDRNHRISASFVPVHFQSGSLASFNNDGNPDILWRNNSTGEIYVLYMDGVSCTGGALLITVADPSWTIVGTDDFNRDRNPDILWRNVSTGENFVLYMDGASYIGGDFLPQVTDPSWTIAGTGEFNSDGNPDILWRNTSTGENIVWYMNGHTVSGWGYPSAVSDPSWTIVGAGDFNSDGKTDILWRNSLDRGELCLVPGRGDLHRRGSSSHSCRSELDNRGNGRL